MRGEPIHGEITVKVLGAAIEVHEYPGPGLLESTDEAFPAEPKGPDGIHPIRETQLMTYMKWIGIRVGLLLNFNVPIMKDGIVRRVL